MPYYCNNKFLHLRFPFSLPVCRPHVTAQPGHPVLAERPLPAHYHSQTPELQSLFATWISKSPGPYATGPNWISSFTVSYASSA